jgi:hypothetical protein
MAKKAAKKPARRRSAPDKKKNKVLSPAQQQQPSSDAASQRFVGDLLVRGEAAPRDSQGNVPLRATHVIRGKKPDGTPDVKRIRFKVF